jgi:hypothetical protein
MSVLLTQNNKRLLLGCYYIYILISFSITSCQCSPQNKKSIDPLETSEDNDTEVMNNTAQLTMEADKYMLLGNDKHLTLLFHSTNEQIPKWDNYRLKVSLRELTEQGDNKIDFEDDTGLQHSIDKQLSDFTNLIKIHTRDTWQLAFNLQLSPTCNELSIKVELFDNSRTTPIETKQIRWKNIQLDLKNLCYNPITGIVTCIIENSTEAAIDRVSFKHSMTGKSTATLHSISNTETSFTLQPLSQTKIEFKLDFNQSDSAEIVFELWYKENKIKSYPITLKDIQISIEGITENQPLKGNASINICIKNKGLHTINTNELTIVVTHPSHVALVLSDNLSNYTKLTPCEFNLSDIVGKKEIAHGDSIPLILQLSETTNQAEAIINLAIKPTQITHMQHLAIKNLIWTPPAKQDSYINSSNQCKSNTTSGSNEEIKSYKQNPFTPNINFTPNQPENTAINNSKPIVVNNIHQVTTASDNPEQSRLTLIKKQKNESTSALVFEEIVSDSTNYTFPLFNTTEDNRKDSFTNSATYILLQEELQEPSIVVKQLNDYQPILDNIVQLAEELYLAPLNNKNELINLIELLWRAIQELDTCVTSASTPFNHNQKEVSKTYMKITKVYKKVAKTYGSVSLELMNTELRDLLPNLAAKAASVSRKSYNTAYIANTTNAYTISTEAYSYAVMGHMACCQNTEAVSYTQQAFELASHAYNAAFKATTKEAYTHATTAYCYATLANNYLFYTITQQEEVHKLITAAKRARKAANNTNFTANLCRTDIAYTNAARAYAGVTNMYTTLANYANYAHNTQVAKEFVKIAKHTAQAARTMANKTTAELAKAAAEDAEKSIIDLLIKGPVL